MTDTYKRWVSKSIYVDVYATHALIFILQKHYSERTQWMWRLYSGCLKSKVELGKYVWSNIETLTSFMCSPSTHYYLKWKVRRFLKPFTPNIIIKTTYTVLQIVSPIVWTIVVSPVLADRWPLTLCIITSALLSNIDSYVRLKRYMNSKTLILPTQVCCQPGVYMTSVAKRQMSASIVGCAKFLQHHLFWNKFDTWQPQMGQPSLDNFCRQC